jgi:predicted DNA-binding protein
MPSQRKKGLKLLGAFVTEEEHKRFNELAKSRGKNAAEMLRDLIEKFLSKNP